MRAATAALLVFALPAQASETAAEFFAKDRGLAHAKTEAEAKTGPASQSKAKEVIAREVEKTLGAQWVSVAFDQARRESNFRPNAIGVKLGKRHGHQRAVGIFQVLPSTARGLGFDPRRLTDLDYGVKVGVAYMGECIKAGVKTSSQMNSCFLYGYHGWGRSNAKKRNHLQRSARHSG
jgi:soluble lytic murein transglycosylase-like protein